MAAIRAYATTAGKVITRLARDAWSWLRPAGRHVASPAVTRHLPEPVPLPPFWVPVLIPRQAGPASCQRDRWGDTSVDLFADRVRLYVDHERTWEAH